MNSSIKIYEARIKSFISFGNKGDLSQKIIIDENSIFSINCVIDFDNYKAIDIETGNTFDILKRQPNGLIICDDDNLIKFNVPYVSEYKEKDMTKVSMLYGLQMKSRAKRAYDEYMTNVVQPLNTSKHVKVKTKKNG